MSTAQKLRRSPVTAPTPAPAAPAPTPDAPTYPRADWERDLDALCAAVLKFPRVNGRASFSLIIEAARSAADLAARCASADHTWSIKCSDGVTRNPAALVGWYTRETLDARARTVDIKARAAAHAARAK